MKKAPVIPDKYEPGHGGEAATGEKVYSSVPATDSIRLRLRRMSERYVRQLKLVPPLPLEELHFHAEEVLKQADMPVSLRNFTTVLVNNEIWRDTFASIPYDRRVLLLPQCLRIRRACPAMVDEFGLLCEQCGRCPTGDLQGLAEGLGYIVLVAEGTTVVTRLIEQGRIDALIGVSCLEVLERAFPHMAAQAIPGIAIPLIRDGCDNTLADIDWVVETVKLKSEGEWPGRLDIEALRSQVESWFYESRLRSILATHETQTERIAISWLAHSGKRWRPLLAVSVYKALNGDGDESDVPDGVRDIAIATECFHKASLVHDDIEDSDDFRYGSYTLHKEYGVPIALNVGDLLLGEGYRLISGCGVDNDRIARMLAIATEGHKNLCLGQGEELCLMRQSTPIAPREILRIFMHKTAPAFEVALRLGATFAAGNGKTCQVLKNFSCALGIAYQIKDDLEEFETEQFAHDLSNVKASILLALAYEYSSGASKSYLKGLWVNSVEPDNAVKRELRELLRKLKSDEIARQLLEYYKNEAVRSLSPLENSYLKSLLRRIVGRVLGT